MKNNTINVLPPAIFNLLAAGEVVENPAAVIKECVENSLDAGATKVEVAIERGGLDIMQITDNGNGVAGAEVEKVFLPHATSKIENAKDLEDIATLGFRGEALSSIAAVSRTTFVTKTEADKIATKLVVEAGKVVSKTSVAANTGTQISIANLFYNTPARKKFLKSANVEKNNIKTDIERLVLANPATCFRYIVDGETIYDFNGKTLLDAIRAVYDDSVAHHLLEINAKTPQFRLSGYVSKPNFTKRNRTYQTLIVNGRAVEGGIIADAVNSAYSNYMTVGNFPFFVLNFDINTSEVDVNIHPRKAQVKFSNEMEIFDFVRQSVTAVVDAYLHNQHATAFAPRDDQYILNSIKHFSTADNQSTVKSAPHLMNKYDLEESGIVPPLQKASMTGKSTTTTDSLRLDSLVRKPSVQEQITFVDGVDFKILGTVFDTYILIVRGENFFMIDQHAAHERLLYDDLKKQIDAGSVAVQRLLEPSVMVMNAQEMSKMEAAVPYLNEMGIECEPFGTNSYRITAVPVVVLSHGIETIIENIFADVKSTPPAKLSSVLKDKIITQCCKNAIKAGQSLNTDQIKSFLSQFDSNSSLTCPHGRPIIISFTRDQLEKLFSRK